MHVTLMTGVCQLCTISCTHLRVDVSLRMEPVSSADVIVMQIKACEYGLESVWTGFDILQLLKGNAINADSNGKKF